MASEVQNGRRRDVRKELRNEVLWSEGSIHL
jgi:hypothetical protein